MRNITIKRFFTIANRDSIFTKNKKNWGGKERSLYSYERFSEGKTI